MKFNLKKPCKNCPFRKDCKKGWLGKDRSTEVANYVFQDKTFPCHKTTGVEQGKDTPQEEYSQCVGAMLLLDKEDEIRSNFLFRLAIRLFDFNPKELKGYNLVFDNRKEMIQHHTNK